MIQEQLSEEQKARAKVQSLAEAQSKVTPYTSLWALDDTGDIAEKKWLIFYRVTE